MQSPPVVTPESQGMETIRGSAAQTAAGPVMNSQFAHMLAHDLRSPLTAIQMSADALFLSDHAPAQERYAAVISQQAQAIAWSLEDLVALADGDAWRTAPRAPVTLASLVGRCRDELQELSLSRETTITPGPVLEDLHVWGVEAALLQALRGCLRSLVCTAPAGSRVMAGQAEELAGQDGYASLSLLAHPAADAPPERLAAFSLPWHRVPLMAAARIVHQHGGAIHELRPDNALGLCLHLPRTPESVHETSAA